MDLKRTYINKIEDGGVERVRLYGEVSTISGGSSSQLYWFDFPGELETVISRSGNPWLACLAPLAVTIGEPLHLCVPVDPLLRDNIQKLMWIWNSWYPELRVVPILAENTELEEQPSLTRQASFFSGGVDSFFTVLNSSDREKGERGDKIDDLLCVWGFDIPLNNRKSFFRLVKSLKQVATTLDKQLIDVATNIRITGWRQSNWEKIAHGCALGAIALALENRYAQVLVPSTISWRYLSPWGSHPITDPLLSSTDTKIVGDGSDYTRFEKVERIGSKAIVLKNLRVCFESRSDQNCGTCAKCIQTMLMLEVLGVLEQCSTFQSSSVELKQVAKLNISTEFRVRHFRAIRARALKSGRTDIVAAIDKMLTRSRWKIVAKNFKNAIVKKVKQWQAMKLEKLFEKFYSRISIATEQEFPQLHEEFVSWLISLTDEIEINRLEKLGYLTQYKEFFTTSQRRYLTVKERQESLNLMEKISTGDYSPERLRSLLVSEVAKNGYDRLNDLTDLVDLVNCKRFVLIGCGPLPLTLFYAYDQSPTLELIGVDIDASSLSIAHKLAKSLRLETISFVNKDGSQFDYGGADIVYVANQVYPKRPVLNQIAKTADSDVQVVVREPTRLGELLSESVSQQIPPQFSIVRSGQENKHFLSLHLLLKIKAI